jgi:hypothetical protein
MAPALRGNEPALGATTGTVTCGQRPAEHRQGGTLGVQVGQALLDLDK